MKIMAAIGRKFGGAFQIEQVDLAAPLPDEVLVKVVAVGICHTDLSVRDGHIPYPPVPNVLGHEGAGVVVECGAKVSGFAVGDHVLMSYASCGVCANCVAGITAYCEAFGAVNFGGRRQDGSCCHHQHGEPINGAFFGQSSFATHAVVNARNLVKMPSDLPLELLAPLGCGIQTGAGTVLNVLRPRPSNSLVVFGLGAVGLSAVMAARISGCGTIVAVDLKEERLSLARELGATHALNGADEGLIGQIHAVTRGGADFVVEAVGSPAVVNNCALALRARGVLALLGASKLGSTYGFDAGNLSRGLVIRAVLEGDSVPRIFIPELIEFYRAGRFPFDRLIKIYEFDQINQASADMEAGIAVKPVLRMPSAA